MNEPSVDRQLPSLRYEILTIDETIVTTRRNIREQDTLLRRESPELEGSLYPEPSYNGEIYEQSGVTADLLVAESINLVVAENTRAQTLAGASAIHAALLQRVPDMSWHRAEKPSYRQIAINTDHTKHNEAVVSLSDYGVESRAYYSRANNATGEAVPGVKPEVFVRANLAEKLQWVNEQLKNPEITTFFGGAVELFVDEGWRDPRLQKYLHDVVIPNLVRPELKEMYPEMDKEELEALVLKESDKKIAWSPAAASDSPAPHESGGASDLTLLYVDTKERLYFGRKPAQMVNRTDPDTFEHTPPATGEDRLAAQNLSALHAIMRGSAFNRETGLAPNPTEFWHWSIGDQLNYIVTGVEPYYGFAPMNGVSTYDPQP